VTRTGQMQGRLTKPTPLGWRGSLTPQMAGSCHNPPGRAVLSGCRRRSGSAYQEIRRRPRSLACGKFRPFAALVVIRIGSKRFPPRAAVELDGVQHLVDPDAYRRGRRKDTLLQENGYFVLRFLPRMLASTSVTFSTGYCALWQTGGARPRLPG